MRVVRFYLFLAACLVAPAAMADPTSFPTPLPVSPALVSPTIEGAYALEVNCPIEAGATICQVPAVEALSLVVITYGGATYVGLSNASAALPFYLFPVTVQGGKLTGGHVQGVPSTISLTLAGDGRTLTGTLHDPSTVGDIFLDAKPVMTLAACTEGASPWTTATHDVVGTYGEIANGVFGGPGQLVIQDGGEGYGLTAAYDLGLGAAPLYFQEVRVLSRQAFTLAAAYPRGDGIYKWCLASTDGHEWRGWSFGTNGYVAPLVFAR